MFRGCSVFAASLPPAGLALRASVGVEGSGVSWPQPLCSCSGALGPPGASWLQHLVPKRGTRVPSAAGSLCPRSCGEGDEVCGLPARLESPREPLYRPPLLSPRLLTHWSREEGLTGGWMPTLGRWEPESASSSGPRDRRWLAASPWAEPSSPVCATWEETGKENEGSKAPTTRAGPDLFLSCQGLPIATPDL